MKVMHVLYGFERGGVQRWLLRVLPLIEDDPRFENAIHVFWRDEALDREFEETGINIFPQPNSRHGMSVRQFVRLWQDIERWQPDVVHLHQPDAGLWGQFALMLARGPHVLLHLHNVPQPHQRAIGRLMVPRIWRNADLVVCCSHAVQDAYAETYSQGTETARVVYYGLPLHDFTPSESHEKLDSQCVRILFAGRLCEQKDVATLLHAAALISSSSENWILEIAGDGEEIDQLKGLSNELGLDERVRFLGERSGVRELYDRADIYVQPSLWEGLPNSIIEAMAMELPIVATEVGGVPEMVTDGGTGLLVPAASPQRLAEALDSLINDGERRIEMGRRGRDFAMKHFDIAASAHALMRVYEELN